MRQLVWGMIVVTVLATGCVLSQKMATATYSGSWEQATLTHDEYGAELTVVRQNDEVWIIEAKTYCIWTRNYVGRQVWLLWGPVECLVKNDNGEVCEFWTKERVR